MPRPASPRKKSTPPPAQRLSQSDWLDAAFAAVVQGGFDRARVLTLAQQLGVTRGSFYWHFASHADLIEALLARWHAQEVSAAQQLRAIHSEQPNRDLIDLLHAALAHAGQDWQNMRFELALRGLGRRNAQVAERLAEVDQLRLALFEEKFLRLTRQAQTAADLAALFYLAVVGCYQALSRPNNPAHAQQRLTGLIERYLIEPYQSPRKDASAKTPARAPERKAGQAKKPAKGAR